jgi:hypothetical protein
VQYVILLTFLQQLHGFFLFTEEVSETGQQHGLSAAATTAALPGATVEPTQRATSSCINNQEQQLLFNSCVQQAGAVWALLSGGVGAFLPPMTQQSLVGQVGCC